MQCVRGGMVYTLVLEASAFGIESSSLSGRTNRFTDSDVPFMRTSNKSKPSGVVWLRIKRSLMLFLNAPMGKSVNPADLCINVVRRIN